MSFTPKDFTYDYPPELIARYPNDKRDHSRLLVLNRKTKEIDHKTFTDISDYFKTGDVLVFNNSKVFPCRLVTKRVTGGKQEILLLRKERLCDFATLRPGETSAQSQSRKVAKSEIWKVLLNANKKIKQNAKFEFENLTITILDNEGQERKALLEYKDDLLTVLEKIAEIPLPPYMNRKAEEKDKNRYQTVYAKETGSVAAPTAGLHFTKEILQRLKDKGVQMTNITLHVGPGTFLPVRCENIEDHKMHTEFFSISQETCDIINLAKKEGRPITAVGTTTTRVLESVGARFIATENSNMNNMDTNSTGSINQTPTKGETDIFIYPPYKFKIIDRLITNFHLPESTLLMLVSAFADRETMLKTYKEAVQERYRLFSYGDCMFII